MVYYNSNSGRVRYEMSNKTSGHRPVVVYSRTQVNAGLLADS